MVGIACCLHPAAAQEPEEEGRDPDLLKKASDGAVNFVQVDKGIKGSISRGASVLVSGSGLDPLAHALLSGELASSGRVRVMDRSILGTRIGLEEGGPASSSRGFELTTEHVQIEAPKDAWQWPPPAYLVRQDVFTSFSPQSVARFTAADEKGTPSVCVGMRLIDARTGALRHHTLQCGSEGAKVRESAVADAIAGAGVCRASERLLQLPVRRGAKDVVSAVSTYESNNEQLSELGCHVLDVPPGAAPPDNAARAWSYGESAFDLVKPAMVEGWAPAEYAVTVDASRREVRAEKLRESLLESLDAELLDPDLERAGDSEKIPVVDLQVKVVNLKNGRIVNTSVVTTGTRAPADVVASVVADLVLGRSAQAWVEVRPIPGSAELRVDRKAVATPGGSGITAIRPGKHKGTLHLSGTPRPISDASFRIEAMQYGVLALATPSVTLTVETTPAGAEVVVDDVPWGPSPASRSVTLGAHVIAASQDDCGGVSDEVTTRLGEDMTATLHLPGFVEATVTPASATVVLNGDPLGQGDVKAGEVPYGANTLAWRLDGYDDETESIAIRSCETTKAAFTFDGSIRTTSTPSGAEFRVNGEAIGQTPARTIVRAGSYDVSCHWCEYGEGTRTVEVRPGETTEVDIPLDFSGFRLKVGAGVGVFAGAGDASAEFVATPELWLNGRFGALTHLGAGEAFERFRIQVTPAARLLAPGPSGSIILGAGVNMLTGPSVGRMEVAPTVAAEGHLCRVGSRVLRLGTTVGFIPDSGVLLTMNAGLNFGSGPRWREPEDDWEE